jgi:alpha-1,6-mannosyltransferase
MKDSGIKLRAYLAAGLLISATALLGYWPGQQDFPLIVTLFLLAFAAYWWLLDAYQDAWLPLLLGVGVIMRLALCWGLPQLSDDVYRFIWDGRLINSGINPFDHLPSYYMTLEQLPAGLDADLFSKLNSPDYFTIYPPVAQGIFAFACWLFPKSILAAAIVMKCFLFAFECISILLLPKLLEQMGMAQKHALWYALNPLVAVEVVGNLHFEGVMVCFLLLSLWWISHQKWGLSAIAMAFSIASKLLPLLFLVFFIRRLGWKKAIRFFVLTGLVVLLLFAPLLGKAFFEGFGSSLDLYFRRFEFNGSIYYLARWLGYQLTGYNLIAYIGPALALGTFTGVIAIALLEKGRDWKSFFLPALAAISLYLFFTTTVHPWYAILPLFLCVFTPLRYPVLWTALMVLTYINYSYDPYQENLWMVLVEYSILYLMIGLEWNQHQFALKNALFQQKSEKSVKKS